MCSVGSWLGIAERPPHTDDFHALITAKYLKGSTHAQIICALTKKIIEISSVKRLTSNISGHQILCKYFDIKLFDRKFVRV